MESVVETNPLSALGDRLRQARLARGMSQEALAQPEFTKSYVSAVERGKARPSLKALELMARRLGVPVNEFLLAVPVGDSGTDVAALDEDLAYQLDHAKLLITTQRGDEALQIINAAEQEYLSYFDRFSTETRYRFYRLRGLAYLRVGEPGSARPDLDRALTLAGQLDDPQEAERARNALGVVFYEQDLPQQALEHHRLCLRAIHEGVVKDPTLRLMIYGNLANDYWALKDTTQAIDAYKEALKILEDIGNLDQQAAIYWGLSMAYKDSGDLSRAKLYAAKALTIYEVAQNQSAIAAISTNLAEIFIEQHQHEEAQQLLNRAQTALAQAPDTVRESVLYTHYATLYLEQGQVDEAAAAAQHSMELSAALYDDQTTGKDAQARAHIVRTYALALSTCGRIAEQQGDQAEADRLFQQALDKVGQTEYAETRHEIIFTYADLLSARGEHQKAASYYRAAAQGRQYRPAD
jgi:tetratricopeptide (TPR) repeat protein